MGGSNLFQYSFISFIKVWWTSTVYKDVKVKYKIDDFYHIASVEIIMLIVNSPQNLCVIILLIVFRHVLLVIVNKEYTIIHKFGVHLSDFAMDNKHLE